MSKVLGQANEKECKALQQFAARHDAITAMFKRCVAEQEQLDAERNQCFMAIRKRLKIKDGVNINIIFDNGEIAEIPKD